MRMIIIAFAVTLSGTAAARAEAAAAVCQHQPALLASAELLLSEPGEAPRFWRDFHGADAAFAAMRYAPLDDAAAAALLTRLGGREKKPQRHDELRFSYASTDERRALIATLEVAPQAGSALPQLGPSVLRALVVEDGGAWLVDEMKRWQESTPGAQVLIDQVNRSAARSIADTDDATKASLAGAAETAGLWKLAFHIHSQRDDLAQLAALLDRAPPDALAPGAMTAASREDLLRHALTLAEIRPTFDMAKQPAEVLALDGSNPNRAHIRRIYGLVARFPDAAILSTLINLTGEMRLASEVAPELLQGIDSGRYDPAARPDELFVAMLERIDSVFGREARIRHMDAFDFVGSNGVGASKASAYADHIVARVALATVVTAGGDAPERPALMSPDFDWEGAVRVAKELAAGSPAAGADALMAANLLIGAERFGEVVEVLGTVPDMRQQRAAAGTVLIFLDRRCDDVLAPTLPFDQTIYRFAPRS